MLGAIVYGAQHFETAELGRTCARIEQLVTWPDDADVLTDLIEFAAEDLRKSDTSLISCRVPGGQREAIAALQACGFGIMECLLTLGRDLGSATSPLPEGVAIATTEDAEACAQVAARVFRTDRYHSDPEIADAAADRLKAAWARNSCAGRADTVLVARDAGRIVGFNACMLRADVAVIDLIGVAPEYQGRGLGKRLVEAAVAHYTGRARRMVVGTQSRNHASLALYAAMGFVIEASAITLHKHVKG